MDRLTIGGRRSFLSRGEKLEDFLGQVPPVQQGNMALTFCDNELRMGVAGLQVLDDWLCNQCGEFAIDQQHSMVVEQFQFFPHGWLTGVEINQIGQACQALGNVSHWGSIVIAPGVLGHDQPVLVVKAGKLTSFQIAHLMRCAGPAVWLNDAFEQGCMSGSAKRVQFRCTIIENEFAHQTGAFAGGQKDHKCTVPRDQYIDMMQTVGIAES